MGGSAILAKVRPYVGTTTTWFVGQAAHIGRFMLHCALMLLFSALLYWRGEQVAQGIRHFAYRLAANAAMLPFCWLGRPSVPWRSAWSSPRWCRRFWEGLAWR
jgi:hypothetical protein